MDPLRHFILDFSVVNDLLHCFNLTWFSSLKLLFWVYSSFWTNTQRLRIVWYMQMLFHLLSVFAVMSAPDYWVVDHVGCTITVAVTSLFAGASPDFWSTRVSIPGLRWSLIWYMIFSLTTPPSTVTPSRQGPTAQSSVRAPRVSNGNLGDTDAAVELTNHVYFFTSKGDWCFSPFSPRFFSAANKPRFKIMQISRFCQQIRVLILMVADPHFLDFILHITCVYTVYMYCVCTYIYLFICLLMDDLSSMFPSFKSQPSTI